MTLEEIKAMDTNMLSAETVARYLEIRVATLRMAARLHPEQIPFPVFLLPNRIKFPKNGFVAWAETGECSDLFVKQIKDANAAAQRKAKRESPYKRYLR